MTAAPFLTALELRAAFASRDLSPVEVVDACAERIANLDAGLCAFNATCFERARLEAQHAEAVYASNGEPRLLEGVPFAVKDLFDTEGVITTYGSPMFSAHLPDRDAEVVRRARAEGGILIGKAQTHEFAWGISSVNTLMRTSRNPWAPMRISGGSSGGSAVALATQQVPLAIGSDTGGSIRVPSGFCGTVGFKPTYGRVSLTGAWPLARTLDHPGPMARTPEDTALLFKSIAGYDPNDPATEDVPLGDVDSALGQGLTGLRVGVSPDLHQVPLTPDNDRVFASASEIVSGLAGSLTDVSLPEAAAAYETFGAVQRAEALFTHREAGLYPDRADEYGSDVRSRLEFATTQSTDEYLRAAAERQRLSAGFARVFRDVDVVLSPVAAGPPSLIGEEIVDHLGEPTEFRRLVMSYTVPQDLAGLPTCVVRAGFDAIGTPVGIQFTGPRWADARVLGAANAFWSATAELQAEWPEAHAGADGRNEQIRGRGT
jgi:aspartyl-tRNA(Asn)/glutamyl-tRNA(Gln) amidotransferase subunit A